MFWNQEKRILTLPLSALVNTRGTYYVFRLPGFKWEWSIISARCRIIGEQMDSIQAWIPDGEKFPLRVAGKPAEIMTTIEDFIQRFAP